MGEFSHQVDAGLILQNLDLDAPRPKQSFFSKKVFVFPDDNSRNPVKEDCAISGIPKITPSNRLKPMSSAEKPASGLEPLTC